MHWSFRLPYLVLAVLKTTVPKGQSKETNYRDYKEFDPSKFKNELKNVLTKENIDSCINNKFDEQFLKVSNSHAPLKRKLLRANTIRKAIMKRFYLGKIYFPKTNRSFLKSL